LIVLDQGGTEDAVQLDRQRNGGAGKQVGAEGRKIRRTFMYKRISGSADNAPLFDTVPGEQSSQLSGQAQKQEESLVQHPAYGMPAVPPPAVIATHHLSALNDQELLGSDLQAPKPTGDLPQELLEKLMGPSKMVSSDDRDELHRPRHKARRWVVVQAPGVGPDGERRFVVEKKDVDMTDASHAPKDVVMPDAVTEDEFVWDILVRTTVPDPAENIMPGTFPSTHTILLGPNSGRLILNENDKDERELFEELYQSDEDDADEKVESDEEDENAEGYYGADYPDEEDEDTDEEDDDEDDEENGNRYYGSDDEDNDGPGYYNEETGRFSKTRYLNTYNDEVQSWARSH
jgi:hypothetical protein